MSRPSAGYKRQPWHKTVELLLNAEERQAYAELHKIIRKARAARWKILLTCKSRSQRQALN